MKQPPIRLRLTLWYFLVFAAAALLLSLASWWMLRHTLEATIYQDLQERVDDIRDQLHHLGPGMGVSAEREYFTSAYQFRDNGKWLRITSVDGSAQEQPIFQSPRMDALHASLAIGNTPPTVPLILDVKERTHKIRMMAASVNVDGRRFLVETGISMTKPDALLRAFGLSLLLLTPGVLLVAAVAGHFMSRKALAPIALIIRQARQINEKNLESRLFVSDTQDELSDLSSTLNHMLQRIDASFRSVRDFTANASHELRTPLARLRTQVEIALFRPRAGADYRHALERTLEDAVEMSGLIDNLLSLARAEAGRDILRLVPLDLNLILDDVLSEWSPIAEQLSLRLLIEAEHSQADDQSVFVLGDRPSLVRLLRILLDNACKFTEPGGSIRIRTVVEADTVLLEVEDSGIGIPAEHQQHVFQRFYRVNGDTGKHRSGAGLGLSLAVWIAEQHKTSISLQSRLQHGSRFSIDLARVPASGKAASHRLLPVKSIPQPALTPDPASDETR